MSDTELNLALLVPKFLQKLDNIESSSQHTIKAYATDLGQVCKNHKIVNESQILSLAREAMSSWSKLKPSSRNRKCSSIKSFFHFLFAEGLTSHDLAERISGPQVPIHLPHFLSVDEALSVLRVSSGPERILFLLLYGGGLRVSEACSLLRDNVDLFKPVIRVRGKGNKERWVALPEKAWQEIKIFLIQQTESSMTIWGQRPLSPRTAYDWIHRLGLRAELLKPLHPHALRHSFATHLLSSGANLRSLQELLGHSSLHSTQRYTHLNLDQLARTMEDTHPLSSANFRNDLNKSTAK